MANTALALHSQYGSAVKTSIHGEYGQPMSVAYFDYLYKNFHVRFPIQLSILLKMQMRDLCSFLFVDK